MALCISRNATSPVRAEQADNLAAMRRGGLPTPAVHNESAWGAQPSQSDRDEPADRGFGRQPASCPERVEAVARKLLRRDVTADVAGLCGLGQQVIYHVVDLLLRFGDVHTSM
jgi:hypothetical protein